MQLLSVSVCPSRQSLGRVWVCCYLFVCSAELKWLLTVDRRSSLTHPIRRVFNDQAACGPMLVMHAISFQLVRFLESISCFHTVAIPPSRWSVWWGRDGVIAVLVGFNHSTVYSAGMMWFHKKWKWAIIVGMLVTAFQVDACTGVTTCSCLSVRWPGSESGGSSSDSSRLKCDARKLQRWSVEFYLCHYLEFGHFNFGFRRKGHCGEESYDDETVLPQWVSDVINDIMNWTL